MAFSLFKKALVVLFLCLFMTGSMLPAISRSTKDLGRQGYTGDNGSGLMQDADGHSKNILDTGNVFSSCLKKYIGCSDDVPNTWPYRDRDPGDLDTPFFTVNNLVTSNCTPVQKNNCYEDMNPWILPSQQYTEQGTHDLSYNDFFFHDTVYNTSVLIVKVSSPNTIFLNNFQYRVDWRVIGEHNSGRADFFYGFITNDTTVVNRGGLLTSELFNTHQRNIRYFHLDIGSINYTIDNRPKDTLNEKWSSGWSNCPWNLSLPAGSWYFVFTGGYFDIDDSFQMRNISVWMNFSYQCRDLNISTYTGGHVYALSYDEFDANIIASRRVTVTRELHDDRRVKGFEVMANGQATFHSNHSFLYYLPLDYIQAGFIDIAWDTPMGLLNYSFVNGFHGVTGPDDLQEPCFLNIGGPGDYHLKLSYVNWKPFFLGFGRTWPVYLIALDIELL